MERAVDHLAAALFATMFGLVLAQVVCRYGFNAPLVWSEEAARYLYVWVALLGWVVAARRGSHIAVTAAVDRLPPRGRRLMRAAAHLCTALFALGLLVHGADIAWRSADVPTVTLPLDFWLVYAAVPLTAALLLLESARGLASVLRRPAA